jgi:type II restriction/modification system DNA methylase subunit YeeA
MSGNQDVSGTDAPGKYFFRTSSESFKNIPTQPIAYWASDAVFSSFESRKLRDVADAKQGMATSDNGRFLRFWHEVCRDQLCFDCRSTDESERRPEKWYAYNKGGEFRRWFGNNEYVVNWKSNGKELKEFVEEINKLRPGGRLKNQEYYFLENITYSSLSSGLFSARYNPPGFLFDTKGSCIFPTAVDKNGLLSMLNSNVAQVFLNILCPTLDYSSIGINAIPINLPDSGYLSEALVELAKGDWDSEELSWDFTTLALLQFNHRKPTVKEAYQSLRVHWREMTVEMQRLEQENNRIFIDAYGLQDELAPEVPLNEVTLTCNPNYRYGGDKSEEELEAMLLADTMRELVSYAVGCMLGRYSLDKPGLILANQGETLADYLEQHRLAQVPQPRFPADDDNVIPVLDDDWFADEITLRFRQFVRVAFGDEHYENNLAFIEQALNLKGKRNYSLRDYFLSEFYADHVKRYKKRPIYWLFSSPKGNFNALIYMHRYRPDTLSVVLRYLRDFRKKVADEKDRQASASINPAVSQGDRTRALKETDRLNKVLAELDDYERDVIYPLATQQIEIDLDDGVKVNYLKFGAALKKIVGLEAKDED